MFYFTEDIELLKELYYKNTANVYFFHERYRLSPAQLARAIRKFENQGLIEFNDTTVTLTENGKKWVLANRKDIFLYERKKYWKEVPENMRRKPIKMNSPYKPINKIRVFYNNIEDGN